MGKIELKGKTYNISDRLERLINLSNEKTYAEKILKSKNYKEGKIPEYILVTALLEMDSIMRENWINIFLEFVKETDSFFSFNSLCKPIVIMFDYHTFM